MSSVAPGSRLGALFIVLLLLSGCGPRVYLDRTFGTTVNPADFPRAALLPISDFRGYPHSGSRVTSAVERALEEKHFALMDSGAVARALQEISPQGSPDASLLERFSRDNGVTLVFIGTLLEFQAHKSYIGARSIPAWDMQASSYNLWLLPTYHRGAAKIRLLLRLFDPAQNTTVWSAEGHASGPERSEVALMDSLARTLLEGFSSSARQPSK